MVSNIAYDENQRCIVTWYQTELATGTPGIPGPNPAMDMQYFCCFGVLWGGPGGPDIATPEL